MRVSLFGMVSVTTAQQRFTRVGHALKPELPTTLRLAATTPSRVGCPLCKAKATLSQALPTPGSPAAHGSVGYRWQNTGSLNFPANHRCDLVRHRRVACASMPPPRLRDPDPSPLRRHARADAHRGPFGFASLSMPHGKEVRTVVVLLAMVVYHECDVLICAFFQIQAAVS